MQKYLYIALSIIVITVTSCAKQSMPTGGAKDVNPPIVLSATPPSGTLEFDEKSFYIQFDEYVVLKDAENNILVSPPMDPKPSYTTKGKGIVVKLKDTLQHNTTYLFQFKEAIADYNEGNLLSSYEYVFSTGDSLSGHTIRGCVSDALLHSARKETITVMLYSPSQWTMLRNLNQNEKEESKTDSNQNQTIKPEYITRADKRGFFQFNYIRPGTYYIVALEDTDKDLQIDTQEPIAFLSEQINAIAISDSILKLSKKEVNDSSQTTKSPLRCRADVEQVSLWMFTQEKTVQRIVNAEFKRAGEFFIISAQPLQNPSIRIDNEQYVWNLNKTRDTIRGWTMRETCDSLCIFLSDSTTINDTIRLKWRVPKKESRTSNAKFNLMLNKKDKMPYFDSIWITFSIPLQDDGVSNSVASIRRMKDSTLATAFLIPTTDGTRLLIDFQFAQGEEYEITVPEGIFRNIWGQTNLPFAAKIATDKEEDYGTLKLDITLSDSLKQRYQGLPFILEILDEKGNTARRIYGNAETLSSTIWHHMVPGKYKIRLIVDVNENREWDGGDFSTLIQPEEVFYYDKTFEIRANWDMEDSWIVD